MMTGIGQADLSLIFEAIPLVLLAFVALAFLSQSPILE